MKSWIAITLCLFISGNRLGFAEHQKAQKTRPVNSEWELEVKLSKKLKAYRRPHFYEEISQIKESLPRATESDLETLELRAKHLLFGEEILLEEIRALSNETKDFKKLIDESITRIALAHDLALKITKEQNNRLTQKADSSLEKPLEKNPPPLFDESQLKRNHHWKPPSRPVIEPK